MSHSTAKVPADTWIKATWDEYLQAIAQHRDEKTKSYYYNGHMRFEMSPVGNPHSRDHFIIELGGAGNPSQNPSASATGM